MQISREPPHEALRITVEAPQRQAFQTFRSSIAGRNHGEYTRVFVATFVAAYESACANPSAIYSAYRENASIDTRESIAIQHARPPRSSRSSFRCVAHQHGAGRVRFRLEQLEGCSSASLE
jgi:hypothetical protein